MKEDVFKIGDKVKIIGYATENQRIFKGSMKGKECQILSFSSSGNDVLICDPLDNTYNMKFDKNNLRKENIPNVDFSVVDIGAYKIASTISEDPDMISISLNKSPNKKVKLLPIPDMISLNVNNK
ncbi:MAG: hypothetical protein V3V33_16635 [Candidatus Lokiarchaeia archaeon]